MTGHSFEPPARQRIVVLGNSGAGKTTLARRLAAEHELARLSLDEVAFVEGATRRPLAGSLQRLRAFFDAHDAWVVEGCYGDLVEAILEPGVALILLDPGIEACIDHCRRRPHEPDKFATPAEQDAMLEPLLEWVRSYDTRDDEYGRAFHQRVFDEFEGSKCRAVKADSVSVLPEIGVFCADDWAPLPFCVHSRRAGGRLFRLADGRFQFVQEYEVAPLMVGPGYVLAEKRLADLIVALTEGEVARVPAILFARASNEELHTHDELVVPIEWAFDDLEEAPLEGRRMMRVGDEALFVTPALRTALLEHPGYGLYFTFGRIGFA